MTLLPSKSSTCGAAHSALPHAPPVKSMSLSVKTKLPSRCDEIAIKQQRVHYPLHHLDDKQNEAEQTGHVAFDTSLQASRP